MPFVIICIIFKNKQPRTLSKTDNFPEMFVCTLSEQKDFKLKMVNWTPEFYAATRCDSAGDQRGDLNLACVADVIEPRLPRLLRRAAKANDKAASVDERPKESLL